MARRADNGLPIGGRIDKSYDSSGSDNRRGFDKPGANPASFRMMLEQRMTRPVPILMSCDSREDERLILEFLYRKFFQVSFSCTSWTDIIADGFGAP